MADHESITAPQIGHRMSLATLSVALEGTETARPKDNAMGDACTGGGALPRRPPARFVGDDHDRAGVVEDRPMGAISASVKSIMDASGGGSDAPPIVAAGAAGDPFRTDA